MTLWICTSLPVKSLLSVLTRCNSFDELAIGQWIGAWRGLVSSSNSCSWFLLEEFNSHIYTPSEESIAQVWPRIVSIEQEPADMRADVFHSDVVLQLGFWSTRSAISKDVCHLVKVPWWHWVDRPAITGFWGVQWRDVHFRCMFMLARPGIQTSIKCLSSYWLQPVMYSSKNFGV